jgi:hypothetical protein
MMETWNYMPPVLQESTLTYIRHHLTGQLQPEKKEVLDIQQTGYKMTEAEFTEVMQDPVPARVDLQPTRTHRSYVPEDGIFFEDEGTGEKPSEETTSTAVILSSSPPLSPEIDDSFPETGFPPIPPVDDSSLPSIASPVQNQANIDDDSDLTDVDDLESSAPNAQVPDAQPPLQLHHSQDQSTQDSSQGRSSASDSRLADSFHDASEKRKRGLSELEGDSDDESPQKRRATLRSR